MECIRKVRRATSGHRGAVVLSTTQVLIGYLPTQAESLVLSNTGNKYAGNGRDGRLTWMTSVSTPRDLGLGT